MRVGASLILLAAFALPLYWPPAAQPLSVPPPDAGLLERLFAGVPAWWVVVRLACLAAGIALLPGVAPAFADPEPRPGRARAAMPRSAIYAILALAVASVFAGTLGRPLQLAYIAALFLPTVLVAWHEEAHDRGRRQQSSAGVVVVVLAWMALRLPMSLHAARIADTVDMTLGFAGLERAAAGEFNVLTGAIQAGGITALHLVPQGAGILGWAGIPLSVVVVQCIHLAWDAVAAVAVALVARRLVGAAAATVAAAAFLFSPYILATPYFLGAVFLGPLSTAVLLLAYLRVRDRGSAAALTLMATVAGIVATHPGLAPIALALFVLALWSSWRQEFPVAALAMPALLFLVTLVPSLPALHHIASLFNSLAQSRTDWTAMEAGLFGQVATDLADFATRAGRPASLDVPLGALLAPFTIPPTPVRLWGWSLFDPLAAIFAAVGIAACLRNCTGRSEARGLLALLALAVLPGLTSSYDRPSLTRMFVLPVPMALLAAIGFDQLRRILLPSAGTVKVAGAVALATAASGLWLFDVLHPRLLPRSATSMALELVQSGSPQKPLLLRHPSFDAEAVAFYAREVPDRPVDSRPFVGPATFDGMEPGIIFWSPGLEESLGVAASICERWPQAQLHVVSDPANRSRLFAARPQAARPQAAWTAQGPLRAIASGSCAMRLPTEAADAADARAQAEELIDAGRQAEAVVTLRRAARKAFVAVPLFDRLARLLRDRGEYDEAEYWAWRASLPKSGDPQPHFTLAEIRAARGEIESALEAARQGRDVAERAGDSAAAAQAEELLQRLESSRGET